MSDNAKLRTLRAWLADRTGAGAWALVTEDIIERVDALLAEPDPSAESHHRAALDAEVARLYGQEPRP